MKIPLGTSEFVRPGAKSPSIIVKNLFFEANPTNEVDGVALVRRPAVRELLTVGDGPIRKIYFRRDLFGNDFFVVSGTELYRVARTGVATFTATQITGTLQEDGFPSMTASGDNLFLTDQTDLYYTNGTAALAAIATPDNVNIGQLAYIGGYILCPVLDSQRFYWINPGDTTIDALNFAEAEGAPDGIVQTAVLGDQIHFFGKDTLEIWYLSGDVDSPFQRVQGRLMETGSLPFAVATVPNQDTLFFAGIDGIVRVGTELNRVSNPGVEDRLGRAIRQNNIANL